MKLTHPNRLLQGIGSSYYFGFLTGWTLMLFMDSAHNWDVWWIIFAAAWLMVTGPIGTIEAMRAAKELKRAKDMRTHDQACQELWSDLVSKVPRIMDEIHEERKKLPPWKDSDRVDWKN